MLKVQTEALRACAMQFRSQQVRLLELSEQLKAIRLHLSMSGEKVFSPHIDSVFIQREKVLQESEALLHLSKVLSEFAEMYSRVEKSASTETTGYFTNKFSADNSLTWHYIGEFSSIKPYIPKLVPVTPSHHLRYLLSLFAASLMPKLISQNHTLYPLVGPGSHKIYSLPNACRLLISPVPVIKPNILDTTFHTLTSFLALENESNV